jgi:hypothetical protein
MLARAFMLLAAVMILPLGQPAAAEAQGQGNVLEGRDENDQLLLRGIVIPDPTGVMGELLVRTHDGRAITLNAPAEVIRMGSRTSRTTQKELQDRYENDVLRYFRAQIQPRPDPAAARTSRGQNPVRPRKKVPTGSRT